MKGNPYKNFNVGNFRDKISSFIESLDVDNFLTNYYDSIDNYVKNTLYLDSFKNYVTDTIKSQLDTVKEYAEKYIGLAAAIDTCKQKYDEYIGVYKTWQSTKQFISEYNAETGKYESKYNEQWGILKDAKDLAEEDFDKSLQAVENYDI